MGNKPDQSIAIVTNWLWKMRGAEKCLEQLCILYPDADVFALFGDKSKMSETIQKHKIKFSFLQKIPLIRKIYRYTQFLWPSAVESFDFSNYDTVISISAAVAKGVITNKDTFHICYLNTPTRYLWHQTHDYFDDFALWKRVSMKPFLSYLRIWDTLAINRVDYLIPISKFIDDASWKYYKRRGDEIIFPPVNTNDCYISDQEDYFIAISPFEENKGGDLIIESAINLDLKVKILGDGPTKIRLQNLAKNNPNIEFLGWVSEKEKYELLSKAKAYLSFGAEDFGITTVEALASGVPVIGLAAAGNLEIVENLKTGVLFDEVSVDSVKVALEKLDKTSWNRAFIKESAKKYSEETFRRNIQQVVNSKHQI